jgi:hypothetical protein
VHHLVRAAPRCAVLWKTAGAWIEAARAPELLSAGCFPARNQQNASLQRRQEAIARHVVAAAPFAGSFAGQ